MEAVFCMCGFIYHIRSNSPFNYINYMKKTIILTILVLGLLSSLCDAQAKGDSLKLSRTEITTLQRNALIIQQNIHMMHLDALLRDKLDSVYSQSAVLFDDRLKVKKP